MTVPRGIGSGAQRVADFVRGLIPQWRVTLTPDEMALATHLRGNQALYDALCNILNARLGVRQSGPVPSDPNTCLAVMSRDSELRWVLATLGRAYRAPLPSPDDNGEQPA